MATIRRAVTSAALFLLFAVPHASADPVKITGGFMVVPGLEAVGITSITGTRDFAVLSGVDSHEGNFAAFDCYPCAPNSPLSVGAILGNSVFNGAFTLDGVLYTGIDSVSSPASLSFRLSGVGTTPPFQNQPVMVTVPFRLTAYINLPYPSPPQPLEGFGISTVTLQPFLVDNDDPLWIATNVRYDFNDATVPEPATLVLVGSGLAGLLYRRRRGQLNKDPDSPRL